MEAITAPRGLVLDLITPLDHGGGIDGRGLGRQLDRTLPYVQAVLIGGPCAGEGAYLAPEQREELLTKVLVVVRGRVPVFFWITCGTEGETTAILNRLENRVKARQYNGALFWVDSPLYYHSNRGLPGFYRELARTSPRPILLHNDPGLIRGRSKPLKRNNIRTHVLKLLGDLGSLKGVIFLGSLDRANNYRKALRARAGFRIYDGEEERFLNHPSRSGVVSAGANLTPGAWREITVASLNLNSGDKVYPDHLGQIWETGNYLRTLRSLYQAMPVSIIKRILYDMGILENPKAMVEREDPGQALNALKLLMQRQAEGRKKKE